MSSSFLLHRNNDSQFVSIFIAIDFEIRRDITTMTCFLEKIKIFIHSSKRVDALTQCGIQTFSTHVASLSLHNFLDSSQIEPSPKKYNCVVNNKKYSLHLTETMYFGCL